MNVTRLFDILAHYKQIKPDQKVALAGKREGKWVEYSLDDYIEQVNYVSSALLALGVKKDDKIAIISGNRPEYNILDMGIMQIGAIPVPIYPTISVADYKHILNHAEITYVFSEGEQLLKKIEEVLPNVPTLKDIYTFKDRGSRKYFAQFLEFGKENLEIAKIEERKTTITPDDIACIMYTSGTTGTPKGVMHTHNNIVMQLMGIKHTPAAWSDKAFSFLPMCHAYEKMLLYMYQLLGMSIYYAESLGTIADNIKEINPTMMTCVPRMLDKIYDKLYLAGKKLPFVQRKLYYWAFNVACAYKIENRSSVYEAQWKLADKLIFSKWRAAIGGNFDIIVSGGSAIQAHIAAFFSAIGMPVYEGYGLTETSPVIAVSSREPNGRCSGTVGKALPGVEIKIDAETNEILCRGHNVMKGYYKDPELTAEVIDKDGWFHTGDTGRFTEFDQLVITGRIKHIFKTSMGKYVNPFLIEEQFTKSPFIENMMVVGENQKFAGAILLPDFMYLKSWAKLHEIKFTSNEDLVNDATVKARYKKEVDKYNAMFGDTEKIKKYELVADDWTSMLTPTLKLKRNIALEFYKELIEKIFA